MNSELLNKIRTLREETGVPVWVLDKCLKIYKGDTEKVKEYLRNEYGAIGDHPEIAIKRTQKKLRETS